MSNLYNYNNKAPTGYGTDNEISFPIGSNRSLNDGNDNLPRGALMPRIGNGHIKPKTLIRTKGKKRNNPKGNNASRNNPKGTNARRNNRKGTNANASRRNSMPNNRMFTVYQPSMIQTNGKGIEIVPPPRRSNRQRNNNGPARHYEIPGGEYGIPPKAPPRTGYNTSNTGPARPYEISVPINARNRSLMNNGKRGSRSQRPFSNSSSGYGTGSNGTGSNGTTTPVSFYESATPNPNPNSNARRPSYNAKGLPINE